MNWEPEHDAQLRALWGDGLTASQISAEMACGVSRNAVIGRVNRLGLSGRARAAKITRSAPRQFLTREEKAARQKKSGTEANLIHRLRQVAMPEAEQQAQTTVAWAEPVIENTIPVGQRCTLMDLTDDTCRWPIGNPQEPDFYFCGGMARDGHPYCGFHMRVAYQPPMARRDRRPFRDDVA